MSEESLISQDVEETVEAAPEEATEQAAPERPEWLPEKFWKDGQPNVENLAKSYSELEKNRVSPDKLKEEWEAERLKSRPEDPKGYALPKDERFDQEQLAASPVVEVFRNAAHAAGMGQEQFEAALTQYADVYQERIQQQMAAETEKLGETAKQRIEAVGQWAQAAFKDEEYDAIAQIATTAAGVKVLEKFMKTMRESGMEMNTDGDTFSGQDTEADILKLMDTPAYYDPARRDPKVMARVEAYFKKVGK